MLQARIYDRQGGPGKRENPPDLEINCNNHSSPGGRGSLASQQEILQVQSFYMK